MPPQLQVVSLRGGSAIARSLSSNDPTEYVSSWSLEVGQLISVGDNQLIRDGDLKIRIKGAPQRGEVAPIKAHLQRFVKPEEIEEAVIPAPRRVIQKPIAKESIFETVIPPKVDLKPKTLESRLVPVDGKVNVGGREVPYLTMDRYMPLRLTEVIPGLKRIILFNPIATEWATYVSIGLEESTKSALVYLTLTARDQTGRLPDTWEGTYYRGENSPDVQVQAIKGNLLDLINANPQDGNLFIPFEWHAKPGMELKDALTEQDLSMISVYSKWIFPVYSKPNYTKKSGMKLGTNLAILDPSMMEGEDAYLTLERILGVYFPQKDSNPKGIVYVDPNDPDCYFIVSPSRHVLTQFPAEEAFGGEGYHLSEPRIIHAENTITWAVGYSTESDEIFSDWIPLDLDNVPNNPLNGYLILPFLGLGRLINEEGSPRDLAVWSNRVLMNGFDSNLLDPLAEDNPVTKGNYESLLEGVEVWGTTLGSLSDKLKMLERIAIKKTEGVIIHRERRGITNVLIATKDIDMISYLENHLKLQGIRQIDHPELLVYFGEGNEQTAEIIEKTKRFTEGCVYLKGGNDIVTIDQEPEHNELYKILIDVIAAPDPMPDEFDEGRNPILKEGGIGIALRYVRDCLAANHLEAKCVIVVEDQPISGKYGYAIFSRRPTQIAHGCERITTLARGSLQDEEHEETIGNLFVGWGNFTANVIENLTRWEVMGKIEYLTCHLGLTESSTIPHRYITEMAEGIEDILA